MIVALKKFPLLKRFLIAEWVGYNLLFILTTSLVEKEVTQIVIMLSLSAFCGILSYYTLPRLYNALYGDKNGRGTN